MAFTAASTAEAVLAAANKLGTDLDTIGTTLTDEAAHNFTLSLTNNSQIGQPQTPTSYQIVLQNTGSEATTYDLSLAGLPAGVTGVLSQSSVTLSPGQYTTELGSSINIYATITSTSATQLAPFSFTVRATAEGSSEISRTATGSFTARSAFVQVTAVSSNPSFTDPGGLVDIKATILNAVNEQQEAEVSYTVTDPSGAILYTSPPVMTTLNVLTTLTTVDLGNLDTTGFALGQDTLTVKVTDASGNPIPGASGLGTLLVGTPVTATLSSSPATLPAGNGTVSNTLQINSSIATGASINLEGEAVIPGGASSVALDGSYAYVAGPEGIEVVDVSNPASPTVVTTFGASQIPGGSDQFYARISGSDLLVDTVAINNSALLVFSLTNPAAPQFLGSTALPDLINGDGGLVVQNGYAFLDGWYFYSYGGPFNEFGDLTSVDLSNPSAPSIVGSLYGSSGGSSFDFRTVAVNDDTLLVASTTGTGTDIQSGTGCVLVVDTTDPANPKVTGVLDIPGTLDSLDIAVEGDQALVIGSTGGLSFNSLSDYGFTGNLVLSTLDISDPEAPRLIASQMLSTATSGSLHIFDPDRSAPVPDSHWERRVHLIGGRRHWEHARAALDQ